MSFRTPNSIKIQGLLVLILGTLVLVASLPKHNTTDIHITNPDLSLDGTPSFTVTPPSPQLTATSLISITQENASPESTPIPTLTPTATPDPFSDLYGCQMSVKFLDGPFETRTMDFEVLGRDYFSDKADKFSPGKGTSVYYEAQRYFILHSSFVNGNILKPMEAEFIRRHLEAWGGTENDYIQDNIESLNGSDAIWVCDGKLVFKTEIIGITRLSHHASQELWLEPRNLELILEKREGLISEWVGDLNRTDDPSILIGFCGWGPNDSNERFSYYRYLINFKIIR